MKWLGHAAVYVTGIAVLGFGVPLAWVWIASQFATLRVGVGYGPLAIMSVGLLATYLALLHVADRFDRRERVGPPRREAWMKSLSAERPGPTQTTMAERVFIWAVFCSAAGFEIWLLFIARTTFS